MKKLILLLFLIPSLAYAVDVTQVSGPDNIFGGGGGVSEGSDVGFSVITGTKINATTGAFTNLSADLINLDPNLIGSVSTPSLNFGDGDSGFYEDTDDTLTVSLLGGPKVTFFNSYTYTQAVAGGWLLWYGSAISGTQPAYTFAGDANTGIGHAGLDQLSHIAGGVEAMRNYTTFTDFYPTTGGAVRVNGGIYAAFRIISSATDTLTSADHTVFCLANDNEVVVTMPSCSGQSYSQQLRIVYTDLGSTNKCKLDGDGAETVASFGVFSGLDTFEEGCHFACDGSGNWWRVGCF